MKKAYIVTGASGSVGSAAVLELASKGYCVIMACRNPEKAEKVRRSILDELPDAELIPMKLDLDSLDSVARFASEVKSFGRGCDLCGLFNNAGIINRDYRRTRDGFENTMQVNCIAPILLCLLLADSIKEGGNIVNMVSLTVRFGNVSGDIFERGESSFSQLGTYSDTKLALLLLSIALQRSCKGRLHVNVADPGIVNSNMISMGRWFDPLADIFFRPFINSPQKGAAPALRACTCTEDLQYFVGKRRHAITDRYMEHPLVDWLWNQVNSLLSEYLHKE